MKLGFVERDLQFEVGGLQFEVGDSIIPSSNFEEGIILEFGGLGEL